MKLLHKITFLVCLFFLSLTSYAQEAAGGEISYKCLGANRYEISVNLYAKCPSPGFTNQLTVTYFSKSSNQKGVNIQLNKSGDDQTFPACTGKTKCEGGTGETADALVKRSYIGIITLPSAASDWIVDFQVPRRTFLNSLAGGSTTSTPMYLAALINNANNRCNSSVTFEGSPSAFASSGQQQVYDPAITSPDNDQLQIALVSPKATDITNVSFAPTYSANQPIKTNGAFAFDNKTGKMTYTPSNQGDMSVVTTEVKEVKDGVVVGSVMRDMYLQTLSPVTAPPAFLGGDSLKFCVGDPFQITYTGAGAAKAVDIIWNNKTDWDVPESDQGTRYKVLKTGTTATFQFNPTPMPIGTRRLDLTLIDDNCGRVNKSVVVKMSPKPTLLKVLKPDSVVLCLKAFNLSVTPIGGQAPYSYTWNTGETSRTISPTAVGVYGVTVKDANGCTASSTGRISSPINFTWGDPRCVNTDIPFFDISNTRTFPPTPLPETKEWEWDFGDGSAVSKQTNPTHKFTKEGTYAVTMKISDGKDCPNSITKNVKVYGLPVVDISKIDSCVNTERSDLQIVDLIKSDTSVKDDNISFYVNGQFRRTKGLGSPTGMLINQPGKYSIKMAVKTDAGCVSEVIKEYNVKNKPFFTLSPKRQYYYRCDLPGFPDTTLLFKGTAVDDALFKSANLGVIITRTGKSDSSITYVSNQNLTVPYRIILNENQGVTIKLSDINGCTNDTTVAIFDPIEPIVELEKYYCFLNDTLKLVDYASRNKLYHWGLDASLWNTKDGLTDTTVGYLHHAYTLAAKSIDEALVRLSVTDKMKCKDSTEFKVYLSEPDTNQFQIVKPMACFKDTVRIFGIKEKYINSWFFRYQDRPELIWDQPENQVVNPSFGVSVPTGIDAIKFFDSKLYTATTSIFYNEEFASKNFEKGANGQDRVPRVPTKVCHLEQKRIWKIVDRLQYGIVDDYDHCYDSLKVFRADTLLGTSKTAKLDTTKWTWSLYSPDNVLLNTTTATAQTGLIYNPATSLFTEVATTRPNYNNSPNPSQRYLPYTVKIKYTYKSDTIFCKDSTTMKVANEKVKIQIDTTRKLTCVNYSNQYRFNTSLFYESFDVGNITVNEWLSTIWDYDGGLPIDTGFPGRVKYNSPQTYTIKAYATNHYGCKAQATATVVVKPSPTAHLIADSVCLGLQNTLDGSQSTGATGSNIAAYYWYFTEPIPLLADSTEPDTTRASRITTENIIKQLFSEGKYPVGLAVRDINGCYDTTQIQYAKVNKLPSVDFTAKTQFYDDEDYLGNEPIVFKQTSVNTDKWEWRMGDGRVLNAKGGDTVYTYPYYNVPPYKLSDNMYDITLKVSTKEGCIDSVTKKIDVNAYFELPNAFSPNDDGLHDQLLGVGKGIKDIKEFKIFNRWGEVIYSINGKPEKDALKRGYLLWDGKYNGAVQPVGAYVYYAVVTTGYGGDIIKKGNLSLLK